MAAVIGGGGNGWQDDAQLIGRQFAAQVQALPFVGADGIGLASGNADDAAGDVGQAVELGHGIDFITVAAVDGMAEQGGGILSGGCVGRRRELAEQALDANPAVVSLGRQDDRIREDSSMTIIAIETGLSGRRVCSRISGAKPVSVEE